MPRFRSSGQTVAAVLTGAWRASAPPLTITAEQLSAAVPLLLASGAGALAWQRIRGNFQAPASIRKQLRSACVHSAMQAARHEYALTKLLRVLRAADVDPILLKGWAVARFYPDSALRPVGDFDLYVASEQREAAEAVLSRPENQDYWVDLDHDELTRFEARSFQDLYKRSMTVKLGDTQVRVLGPEDQLRTLCLHFIKHGGWRPVWLCDIAAILESRHPEFDWERCLPRDMRYRQWVLCTLSLAHSILHAELGDAPVPTEAPNWITTAVLKQWNELPSSFLLPIRSDVRKHWRAPGQLLAHLAQRWPNPIQATVDEEAEFDDSSRLPFQIRHCLARGIKVFSSSRPGD